MQVQVALTFNSQKGARSTPLTVGMNYVSTYIYLLAI